MDTTTDIADLLALELAAIEHDCEVIGEHVGTLDPDDDATAAVLHHAREAADALAMARHALQAWARSR